MILRTQEMHMKYCDDLETAVTVAEYNTVNIFYSFH